MTKSLVEKLDWEKGNGLLPVIVQHADTGSVLMLAYMNCAALEETLASRQVTFYSRSKQRLWRKGEASGNTLALIAITPDCDADTLLVSAKPAGPVCHTGNATCFNEQQISDKSAGGFLAELDTIIAERRNAAPETSYTARLLNGSVQRLAQKVGEEAVETALAAAVNNKEDVVNEVADLVYHLQVLLQRCGLTLNDVEAELRHRHEGTN